MKALKVSEIVRRGNSSRIADELANKDNFDYEVIITVAQNAPCCIKSDGTTPKREGWEECFGEIEHIGNPMKPTEIWIKTATLGGRRRMWCRNAY
jgi:hypothetical protein